MKITPLEVPGYQKVARAEDPATGLVAFIAVHDTTMGPALGGMRMWGYESEEAARFDVLRLARGMTYKSAVARTGLGGGKSVIVATADKKSPELFAAMGRFIDTFNGLYITAEDVNVDVPDLIEVRKATKWVTGLPREQGGSGNPSPYTARGCFVGVRAAAIEAFGSDDLKGKRVALQGPGHVGFPLAQMLVEAGAKLVVADVNAANVERCKKELGAESVAPAAIYDVDCDIYAPCALGATLNDDTIPRLKAKAIAGAANNQLLDEKKHGAMIAERGIVYAPDYVINAGGIINVSLELEPGGYREERAIEKIDNIFHALQSVFATAREKGITTHAAAQAVAEANIREAAAAKAATV
ncbi:MAG: Glu/Leu/Phe/Val dehydrogenase [Planctomycetes bacterium]|nr:Glu/Leu/Phe/Val dehydrogenase [Planctomycetota bacterium]